MEDFLLARINYGKKRKRHLADRMVHSVGDSMCCHMDEAVDTSQQQCVVGVSVGGCVKRRRQAAEGADGKKTYIGTP
jgi:hypothetical protein